MEPNEIILAKSHFYIPLDPQFLSLGRMALTGNGGGEVNRLKREN